MSEQSITTTKSLYKQHVVLKDTLDKLYSVSTCYVALIMITKQYDGIVMLLNRKQSHPQTLWLY